MKVAHFAELAPNKCGLYHTTKDLVKAEKMVGIDAHFVDVRVKDEVCHIGPGGQKDGKLTTSDSKVADDADILVRHTSIPNELENSGIPVIMAIHGRPESSLLLDERKEIPVIQALHNKGQDCRYKGFFTFWKEHLPFWRHIVPQAKLYYVPAMVDLMDWRPGNVKAFDLGKNKGNPNILICDIWRDDVTPFEEIMAVTKFIKEQCPKGRLHIAAAATGLGANIFWRALRKDGILGYAVGQTKDIKELYEAADVIVTPHTIATRVVREGLATGTPVISGAELPSWWELFKEDPARQKTIARKEAEQKFNLRQTGEAIRKMFEGILNQKPKGRYVFLDIGGHKGETVRRFYRQVEDARHYEIHTFEPYPACFHKMKKLLRLMRNVKFTQIAIGARNQSRDLYYGAVNEGDGSTTVRGKRTGGIDYKNPTTVRSVKLAAVLAEGSIKPEDYIVLKMNIEGGEYEVMQNILDEKLMPYFNQVYIQTHKHKLDPNKMMEYMALEVSFMSKAKKHNTQIFMRDKGMAPFQCKGVAK